MITVFSKEGCSYCERAINLLKKRNIPYEVLKLDEQFTKEWIQRAFPAMMTFPVIVQNNQLIGGFNELMDKLIDDRYFGKDLKLLQE